MRGRGREGESEREKEREREKGRKGEAMRYYRRCFAWVLTEGRDTRRRE
jgi:hypothetical protein